MNWLIEDNLTERNFYCIVGNQPPMIENEIDEKSLLEERFMI